MTASRDPHTNIGSWLRDWAAHAPERTAVIDAASGARLGYAELNALANRIAAGLRAAGAREGERVALAIGSSPLYLAIYFACAKLGAILVPLNTRLAQAELAFQLADAEPCLTLVEPGAPVPANVAQVQLADFLAALPAQAPEPELAAGGEAPHVLLYTSGTTGHPKGAVLPQRKTLYNTLNAEHYFGLSSRDVVVIPVPLFHSYGLKILAVPALFCGAATVLVERFDPLGLQETVARHGGTLLGAVPIMYQRMLRAGLEPQALPRLRLAYSAGAALDPEIIRAYHAQGVPLIEGYGQTETSTLCCMDAAHALEKAGSVGRAVVHAELRVADEQGRTLPPGDAGEVLVRGPICMLGYWRRPEETRAALLDGWHRTGDLGTMDAEGYVRLVGRRKDMYISGGENVYAAEVERVIEQHPDVVEAAVVGVADPEWGETGRAYVVCSGPALDADSLTRFVRSQLAHYKCPRQWIRVESLPRTASGKVQKHRLRDGA